MLGAFFFPFVLMVLSSFKTHDRMTDYPPVFRFEAALDNDRYAVQQAQFFECTIGFFEEVPIELEEAAMITLPVVLMVRAAQRQFIRGLAIGGVKG